MNRQGESEQMRVGVGESENQFTVCQDKSINASLLLKKLMHWVITAIEITCCISLCVRHVAKPFTNVLSHLSFIIS